MNKKLLLIFFLFVAFPTLFGQQPYYDAIKLRNLIDTSTGKFKSDPLSLKDAGSIIYNYLINPSQPPELMDYSSIKLMLSTKSNINYNPFLITFLSTPGSGETKSLSMISSTLKNIGGLDVTNFADGLAKFLVERVKQELSTSFFERFKNALDSNEQLGIMFPVTRNALKAIDKEIYNYSAYLDLLRDSFQKDLVLLLPHIDQLINDKSMDVIFSKYPEVRVMFSHAFYIVNEFSKGEFPGEVYHNYVMNRAMKDSLKLKSINIYLWPSIATLDLFSQSLRSSQPDQYWISSDSLRLLSDDITFQIYIGLIYQQVVKTPIYFTDKISFASFLKEYGQKVFALKILYEPYLTGLLEKGKSIDFYYEAINDKQKAGNDKPTYQDYFSLYDASVNFMEFVSQAPFLDTLLLNDNLPNLEDYFSSARSMGNIYVDIYEKQYTSAIVEFTGIFQILLNEKIKLQIDFNKTSMKSADPLAQQVLKQTNNKLEEILEANALILKYGSLAASIAKAETSDDVNNAIEAAALPAGSSRIKRETPFNVSLNAYTGLFLGYEKITGFDDKIAVNSYGLAAPVGVAISSGQHRFLGMPYQREGHWSYSAFVSFIDIGTIAAFRFQNDSVDQVPTIKLQDIFSPGLFFSVGIPKCPLSVNMGAQVGPNLRKVNVEDENGDMVNKYQDNVYWRFSVSVVVDIPILNFYTKSR